MLKHFHMSPPLLLEEYPKLTVFALHPGAIKTQMAEETGIKFPDDFTFDAVQLPAATMLYLTSGRVDWLNGKSVLYVLGPAAVHNLTSSIRQIFVGHLGYCRN